MLENIGQWALWIFLLGCMLPLIVLAIASFFAYRFGKKQLEEFIEPDIEKLNAQYEKIRQKQPDLQRDKLIRQVVNQQALKCGIVGAITGVGGFVTMPISLPIDILVTARMQSTMVGFIARAYGYENSIENKAATVAVMTGSNEITALTGRVVRSYAPRFLGKSFSKLIPLIGGFISFGLNYALAQSMARIAIRWYENKSRDDILGRGQASATA